MKYIVSILFLAGFLTASFSQTPDFTGIRIMINPGHGGHDSDDRGQPNGFWESEGNLTKGLWLRDLLEARGAEVIMSRVLNRTEDDLPLSQIAAMANDNNVDLFLSIHSNAGNQTSNYPMTIFNGKSEDPANPQAKVWARILWEHLITNEATYWTYTDPKYIGDLTLNPSWSYGYGVLYPLTVPGIISEGSFHDYRPEQDRLLNLEYRKQEAWNMLYAMEEYFALSGNEPHGNISGIIRDSLLIDEYYSIAGSPDKYIPLNGTEVELLETGEKYYVDTLNTGYYSFDSLAPGNYHLVFSAYNYFNDTLELAVTSNQFKHHNHWLEADKTMPPKIISYSPAEGTTISCFDPLKITFTMNMDSATFAGAFNITPEIDGKFNWDKKYLNVLFQPDIPYDTSTVYTVFIDSTAEHQWGVRLDTTLEFSFRTDIRNRYNLRSSYPADSQDEISPYLQFRLVFDAPLENSSLINAVSIIPDGGVAIGTKGASVQSIGGEGHYYFSPAEELVYGENYTLQILGSVKDENQIPLVDTQRIRFSTREALPELVILEEFDDTDLWSIDFAGSPGTDPSSFLYRWTKTKRSGSSSMLLRHTFLDQGSECILRPDNPVVLNDADTTIATGLWIWGEMSNNMVSLGFDEGSEVGLDTINFAGWKYCSTETPAGANTVEYLKISRIENGAEGGDIYFDALSQPVVISGIERPDRSKIVVFPNPLAGQEIRLIGLPAGKSVYSIYSMTGKKIQKGRIENGHNAIRLNDESLNQSMFVLNITSNSGINSFILINSLKPTMR